MKLITVNVSRYALVTDAIIGGRGERGRASPTPYLGSRKADESKVFALPSEPAEDALPSENYERGGAEEEEEGRV